MAVSREYIPTFKPLQWRSLVNGKIYPVSEYRNTDLPSNEYPFTVDFEYTALHQFSTIDFTLSDEEIEKYYPNKYSK